jgi:hypothetical protein
MFVICCSFSLSHLTRRLSGKSKKEAIPQESPDSPLNLPSYLSEKKNLGRQLGNA